MKFQPNDLSWVFSRTRERYLFLLILLEFAAALLCGAFPMLSIAQESIEKPRIIPLTTTTASPPIGYFQDPYPVHLSPLLGLITPQLFSGTTKELLACPEHIHANCVVADPITMDAGSVGKEAQAAGDTITSFINSNIYQDNAAAWHMVATMYLKNPDAFPDTKNWTVIVHAHPTDPFNPKDWVVDTLLVGSLSQPAQANYDGKYYVDEGKIYLIYSRRLSATRAEDGIVAQPMDSFTRLADVNPTLLLAPQESEGGFNSELFFGLESSADFRLVETGNVTKIEGRYAMAYSTGAYFLPGYKTGVAWSDTLIPRSGATYKKALKQDTDDVWGQPDHREVVYLLQSQKSAWPNYVANQVLAPGVPSIVRAKDGNWRLFFAGYSPDDAPLVKGTNQFQPLYRRPYTTELIVAIPAERTVDETSNEELATWITLRR